MARLLCRVNGLGAVMLVGLSWNADRAWSQQLEPRVGALVTNRHLWRGIRRAAGWNAQPEVSLGLRCGPTRVAAGIWSNIELSTHRDSSLTDLRPGRRGFSELDFWAEATHGFTQGHLAAGFVWYQYRGRLGSAGTGEIYARYRGSGANKLKLSPELSVWYDPVKRNSGYLETGLAAAVLALPFLEPALLIHTETTAGFALGTPDDVPELAAASFRESGFTHADLSAGIRVRQGSLIANLSAHVMYAHDPATLRKTLRSSYRKDAVRPFITLEGGVSWPAYSRE